MTLTSKKVSAMATPPEIEYTGWVKTRLCDRLRARAVQETRRAR